MYKMKPNKAFLYEEKWEARISQKLSFQVKTIKYSAPLFWSEWEEIYKNILIQPVLMGIFNRNLSN